MSKHLIFFLLAASLSAKGQNNLITFKDTTGFYSLSYPSTYEKKQGGPFEVMFVMPLTSAEDKYRDRLFIDLHQVPPDINLDTVAVKVMEQLKGQFVPYSTLGESIKVSAFKGEEARELSILGKSAAGGETVTFNCILLVRNNILFRYIEMTGIEYALEIMKSPDFKFGEPAALQRVINSIVFH